MEAATVQAEGIHIAVESEHRVDQSSEAGHAGMVVENGHRVGRGSAKNSSAVHQSVDSPWDPAVFRRGLVIGLDGRDMDCFQPIDEDVETDNLDLFDHVKRSRT